MKKVLIDKKYLIIHGHFYQPPRENPWLEDIEIQPSAYPFHNWNERINFECYRANAFSKISDDYGKIIKMVNNYSRMSFNFGPTLLSWIEENDKETYEKILEADRLSAKENNGKGNAIAQVYNHMIMPLANKEDKETQIKWGKKDFEKRFGRSPKGMWLSETGIDYPTLEALIENDIKFTILSPHQAKSIRKIGAKEYTDVLGGKIDSSRVYRAYSKKNKNKYLDIFFYDGNISNSVGYEDTVNHSGNFLNRLKLAVNNEAEHSQVINIATDGETYGHHKKFADFTLAHLLFDLAEKEGFDITNYENYLAKNEPLYEVILNDAGGQGTAWSCAHGVGRWKENCGCCTGMNSNWNQEWRKPLREGLDSLRDSLIAIYEKEGEKYLKNIWNARNNYIEVILDRSDEKINNFLEKESKYELMAEDKILVLKLMEIQRNSLLMYTSCGWFFDELSGIETEQILKYAAKAISLAQDFTNEDLDLEFMKYLSEAKSNITHKGNGEDIFRDDIKKSSVDFEKMAAYYGITSMFEKYNSFEKVYNYEIEREDYYKIEEGSLTFTLGKLKIKNITSLEIRNIMFGVLRFGETEFRCSVKNIFSNSEYISIKNGIMQKLGKRFSIVESLREIDNYIGKNYFTFDDLLLEEKRKILKKITNKFFMEYEVTYDKIYRDSSKVIEELNKTGLKIPEEYKIAAEYSLGNRLRNIAFSYLENSSLEAYKMEIKELMLKIRRGNYSIDFSKIRDAYTEKLKKILQSKNELDFEDLIEMKKMFEIADAIGIYISENYIQFMFYEKGLSKDLEFRKKEIFLDLVKHMNFSKETFIDGTQ